MTENAGESSLRALRTALQNPAKKKKLVDGLRERHWPEWSYRQAQVRLDQMLEPTDSHGFKLDFIDLAIECVGDAAFLDPLLAVEAKVLRQVRRASQAVPPLGGRRGRAA